LLEKKNGGYLTRENVTFIVQRVQQLIAARKGSLVNGPDHVRLGSAGGEIARRMDGVVAGINRDLEIRVRKQQAFPREEVMREKQHVSVTIQNAANVNLGSQVGYIHASLDASSDQSQAHHEVATALKELSDAVIKNERIQDSQKEEALQVITEIAKQAEAKPEARSLGTLKAMVVGLHAAVGVSNDLAALWDKYAPAIKHFFGI
jgi:di/tripeptidase